MAALRAAVTALQSLARPGTTSSALTDAAVPALLVGGFTELRRLQAALSLLIGVLDERRLWTGSGFHGSRAWLQGYLRLSGGQAMSELRVATAVRDRPEFAALGEVFAAGRTGIEQLNRAALLHRHVGADAFTRVGAQLADAAAGLDVQAFEQVCARVRHWVDADPPPPDPHRFGLTLAKSAHGWHLRGFVEPDVGAALHATLQAFTVPPGPDDRRSAATRRKDALAELCRDSMRHGRGRTVGGATATVGVLFPFHLLHQLGLAADEDCDGCREALTHLELHDAGAHAETGDAGGGSRTGGDAGAGGDPGQGLRRTGSADADRTDVTTVGGRPRPVRLRYPGGRRGPRRSPDDADGAVDADGVWRPAFGSWLAEPAWLDGFGPVPQRTAQRLLCDADAFRLILDPEHGLPLDVGRTMRLAPPWMRRALWQRDKGCVFPGCQIPPQWTDAHHVDRWKADHGTTAVHRLASLCRRHHVLVHEGRWTMTLDATTAEVRFYRPDGTRFRLPGQIPQGRAA